MDTVLRVVITYVFILVGLRIMGKREFSQMSPVELVTLLLIPEIFSQAIVREDFSMTNAIIAISTLFAMVYATSILHHLSEKFAVVVSGKPTVLVSHGKLVTPNLNVEHVTPDEIFTEMHKAGFDQLDQIEWAVLEPDGRISIVPNEAAGRAIPKQAVEELFTG